MKPSMRGVRVPLAIGAGLVLAVIAGAALSARGGAGGAAGAPASSPETPLTVRAETAHATTESGAVHGVGTVHAWREAELAGKLTGRVIEIRKQAGESVRRGEVIVVLDARDVAAQIAQAEGALAQARASLVLAEANFNRFDALHARGSASALELDQARYQRDAAVGAVTQSDGAVAAARSSLAYAEIAAPFDGRMVDRIADIGDLATPGVPLARVEDTSRLTVHVALPAAAAAGIAPGSPAEIEVPAAGDRAFAGSVTEIVPAADPGSHTVLVKVALPGAADLRSGLYARASFPAGTRRVMRVPASAVVTRGGLTGVFVAENGRAAYRLVELAAREGAASRVDRAASRVEVISGLADGDVVIAAPPEGMETGRRVEVGG